MCCNSCKEHFQNAASECFDSRARASEMGKSFRIEHPRGETFCRMKADGCIIPDDQKSCDYVFRRCTNSDHYFVELKGSDIGKAYTQIVDTLPIFKIPKEQIFGFIVCSKVPSGVNVPELKKRFKQKHGENLEVSSNGDCTHRI